MKSSCLSVACRQKIPCVVKKAWKASAKDIINQIKKTDLVFSYCDTRSTNELLTFEQSVQKWKNDETVCVKTILNNKPHKLFSDLTFIELSDKSSFSPFTLDSHVNPKWLYVLEGKQRHYLVPSSILTEISVQFFDSHDMPYVADLTPDYMKTIAGVFEEDLEKGDFIYWPSGYIHMSENLDKSIVLSGYIDLS